ncbi:phosphatidate cytidylyltransferase [Cerasicoccus arenae]|uniref:Phosphatidate cytidylyltransferase n=1 Tax=Cerasicoccus arenae TaxID=424488 RepID=A0A8J3DK71_9BACT|nr:phosphatidate cytidylyltransferase [Cerasicoccus arenae]MBK1859382.1 phosphatidate cytidylyltransferase [Cerasicoccus arenae]GHC10654.1 phosphatidate cytidylyltransferase [Cerasicoccus arenae]
MKARILSTVGLWGAIIAVILIFKNFGGVVLLTAITILAQLELYAMLEAGGKARPMKILGVVLGAGVMMGSYFLPVSGAMEVPAIALIILSLTLLQKPKIGECFMPTMFGLVYLPFLLQFYGLMLAEWGSIFLPIWVIAVAKFSDVGGLLVGKKFGKTKLAPSISPGKTIEGAAGGVLASALVGVILAVIFQKVCPIPMPIFKTAIVGGVIGCVAIVSDLLESQLKRWAGVKDSGSIIPGIGGAFDLIDSLVLTGPIALILFQYVF